MRAKIREKDMRISILLVVLIGFFSMSDTYAQKGSNQGPAHATGCADLRKNASKGLYGHCVAFCSSRDQSNVDLNDIASVKAAAPDIATLRRYNALMRPGDPGMPCMRNGDSGNGDPPTTSGGGSGSGSGDESGGDSGGDTSGDTSGGTGSEEPPPPSQCACWTGAELASIDGDLPAVDGMTSGVDCTSNTNENGIMYENQAAEGYDFLGLLSLEGVAWTSIDAGGMEPYNGCFFSNSDGFRNFPLEKADAQNCMQEVATHCAALGNP